ncbi:hypothetical protein JYQ62_32120 [Nostoc sp. UHCC 0702]|nr:hypothetical protein JYQ62_32120 [Nostoc sp. UHCC 0702]
MQIIFWRSTWKQEKNYLENAKVVLSVLFFASLRGSRAAVGKAAQRAALPLRETKKDLCKKSIVL